MSAKWSRFQREISAPLLGLLAIALSSPHPRPQSVHVRDHERSLSVSAHNPRARPVRSHYRCEPHWRVLMDWLESNGISARKKIHELRKIFGDAIVKQNGIFAGSAQLRHSTIQMTAGHYADPRQRAALPVGNVFSEVIEQDSKTNQPQMNSSKAVPRVKPGTGGISHVS